MLPEFPNAQEAIKKAWNRRLFKALGFSDPLISRIPLHVQREGNKAMVGATETKFRMLKAEHQWKPAIGQGIPLDDFFALADRLGDDMARQQAQHTMEILAEQPSTRHSVLKKTEGSFSFDDVLSELERMEIDFDERGMPMWPTVFLGTPALQSFVQNSKAHELNEERRKRMSDLVARKRKEFDEREARRRLVD